MRVADFSFDLPDELIARFPKADRTSSRLLTLDDHQGKLSIKYLVIFYRSLMKMTY